MFYKVVAFLFVTYPLFSIYASIIPGVSLGEFALLLTIVMTLALKNRRQKLFKIKFEYRYIFIYLLYAFIVTVLACVSNSWIIADDVIYELVGKMLFFSFFFFCISFLKKEMFIPYFFRFSDILVAFFFLQFFLSLIGIPISGIIPFLSLSNGVETVDFAATKMDSMRLSSFLSEPAHYCQFLFIPLVLSLFEPTKNKLRVFLYTLSILMSFSANGFALVVISWGCYLLSLMKSEIKLSKIFGIIFIVSACVATILVVFSSEISDMLLRFSELAILDQSSGPVHASSGYMRVLRGYIPFYEYSTFSKIFGYGFGSLNSYIINNPGSDYLKITSSLPLYVNSIQYVLLSTGFIGMILIATFIYKLYKETSCAGKILIINLIMLSTSSAVFFTYVSIFVFYIAFIFKTKTNEFIRN